MVLAICQNCRESLKLVSVDGALGWKAHTDYFKKECAIR